MPGWIFPACRSICSDQFPEPEPGGSRRRTLADVWSATGSAHARDYRGRVPERALGRDRDDGSPSPARIGLSLDDFGTGYSSLNRLAHLPIRELKIDRSFISDVENDPSARAIVTAVVRVGQSLQLTVVAEGVETDGQRNLLAELGCDVVQGFLYAPALSSIVFGRWLLEHSANRASAMLRTVSRSLAQPPAGPSRRIGSAEGQG